MELPETMVNEFCRVQTVCVDGFKMSVQASSFHYCRPRRDGLDEYEDVEVGFPSEAEELLLPYIEIEGESPTGSVYPHVPMSVIEQIVEKHGGLKA